MLMTVISPVRVVSLVSMARFLAVAGQRHPSPARSAYESKSDGQIYSKDGTE